LTIYLGLSFKYLCKNYLKAGIVMAKKGIYKVVFVQLGEIYEIYAEAIYQSDMYGFIEVEEYIFDQNSQIVVDPNEEKLKNEFKGVQRSYIPINCIMRIDEVDKKGKAKITSNDSGKVMPMTNTIFESPGTKKD
jgi:hypothetical protein|tara:strand:- start:4171 stop:4572 length:402 start_codon:yes stop_codon:yes gene_type:complete